MDCSTREIFREMIIALDGCTETLRGAAEREKRKPAVGGLRKITEQKRLAFVESLIRRAEEHLKTESSRPDPLGEALNSGDGTYRP